MKKYSTEKERRLAISRSNEKCRKKHMKRYVFYLRNEKDADVINKLESVPSKTKYIRNLIREDIKAAGAKRVYYCISK